MKHDVGLLRFPGSQGTFTVLLGGNNQLGNAPLFVSLTPLTGDGTTLTFTNTAPDPQRLFRVFLH
jgi:hypothetical protein